MSVSALGKFAVVFALALALITVLGCSSKDDKGGSSSSASSKSGKWEGTYFEPKDKMTLTLAADHKGTMSADGKPGEITWEAAGDDKITIGGYGDFIRTSDGNLRDDGGNTWTKK